MPQIQRNHVVFAAVVAASLAVGAATAVLTDTVPFVDNHADTNAIVGPDLQVALIEADTGEDCENANWRDEPPNGGVFSTVFDLEPGQGLNLPGYPGQSSGSPMSGGTAIASEDLYFCLRNASDHVLEVTWVPTRIDSVEIGSCPASEQDAGDESCDAGERGELENMDFHIYNNPPRNSCGFGGSNFPSLDEPMVLTNSSGMQPGEECRMLVRRGIKISGDDAYLRAQTDRLIYQITFEAREL